jgi:hypothetical protein
LYIVCLPDQRNRHPKTRFVMLALASIIVVISTWHMLAGNTGVPSSGGVPPGAPAYCAGQGNDVGQGAVIDAEVDRDCPQMHNYRVSLYQMNADYTSSDLPTYPYPWCAVLGENPCVATQDMYEPATPLP